MTRIRICSVEGCGKIGRAAGMCHGHYKRLKAFGSTDVKSGSKAPLSQRFWLYVKRTGENDCWLWTGSKRGPYGKIKANKKTMLSHRVSYELHFGNIHDGMLVCHKCDVPECVNPKHLFIGTQSDNLKDCRDKGRFDQVNGSRQWMAKLTDNSVLEILKDNRKNVVIAEEYGVSAANISYIKSRKTWKHVCISP